MSTSLTNASSSGTTRSSSDPAGQIGDALNSFKDALASAVNANATDSAGDPRVCAAVQLGWVMSSVLSGDHQVSLLTNVPLTPSAVNEAQALQITALLKVIDLPTAPPGDLIAKLTSGQDVPAEAAAWQGHLIVLLLGTDVRLAKAYEIGFRLKQLASVAPPAVATFRSEDVSRMLSSLDDLSTALPAHAARGVAYSVRRWQAGPTSDRSLVEAQCELWRVVLTDEKKCTEMLEPENYLDAAERLSTQLRTNATSLLRQYFVWVALVVALLLGAAAVLLFAHGAAAKTAAAVSGVLVAFGLSWKGLGTALGKVAGRVEGPLWGAEIDGAVTDAITIGVQAPKGHRPRHSQTGDYAGRAMRLPLTQPAASPAPPPTAALDPSG